MIRTSDSTRTISTALFAFQGLVEGVKRDGANQHFRSKYATLENVIDTARPGLQEVGVMFTQAPGAVVDGALEVTTRLTHAETGEWIESTMQIPLGKQDPQGAGSALTYSMRYSLMALLGLPPTDDDAEGAMDRSEPAAKPKRVVGVNPKTGMQTAYALKNSGVWDNEFQPELLECETIGALTKFALAWSTKAEADKWPVAWRESAKEEINKRREVILNGAPDDDFPGDRPNGNRNLHMAG